MSLSLLSIDVAVNGTCVTRNASGTVICGMRAKECVDGKVEVGFVSKQLKRSLHAGASIGVADLDRFCRAWLRGRDKPICDSDDRSGFATQSITEAICLLTNAAVALKGRTQ